MYGVDGCPQLEEWGFECRAEIWDKSFEAIDEHVFIQPH
jgi:hypothetical protein